MEHSAATDKNGQAGFSLPELLLVMVLAIIVIGLPLTLALSSFSAQNQSASRSASAARAQIGIDRLVRDLRQSITASITSTQAPATAVLTIPTKRVNNAAQPATQVTWICTTGATCTRTTGGGDVRQLIPGVTAATFTPTFFAGATGPSRVDVSVTAQVLDERRGATETLSGANAVTFRDGVDLRNSR